MKRKAFHEQPIVVLMVLFVMGIFLIVGSLIGLHSIVDNSCQGKMEQIALGVEKDLEKAFDIIETIESTERLFESKEQLREKLIDVNQYIRVEGLAGISVATKEGRSLGADGKMMNVSHYKSFQEAIKGNKSIEWIENPEGSGYIVFAEPYYIKENLEGVICGIFEENYVEDLLLKRVEREKGISFITDGSKVLAVSNQKGLEASELNQITSRGIAELIHHKEAKPTKALVGTNNLVYYYEKIPSANWTIVQALDEKIYNDVDIIQIFIMLVISLLYILLCVRYIKDHRKKQTEFNQIESSQGLMVMRVDGLGKLVYANQYTLNQLGYTKKELIGKNISEVLLVEDGVKVEKILKDSAEHFKMTTMDLNFLTQDYKRVYAICTIKYNFKEELEAREVEIEIAAVDISQFDLSDADKEQINSLYEEIARSEEELQKRFEELCQKQEELQTREAQLKYIAYFDELTGMPNKNYLKEKITECGDCCESVVCIYMDVDNFKFINDSFGHDYGDCVLVEISKRLLSMEEQRIRIGRIAADEFAIIAGCLDTQEGTLEIVEQVEELFQEPFIINEVKFGISFSMGIALYPKDARDFDELLNAAGTAMHHAKAHGKRRKIFFDSRFKENMLEKVQMESDLRQAIIKNEFKLYYQPQMEISTGKIKGFEALIRWIKEDGKMVSPVKFIGVAEETGLMIPIGEWVIREACGFINELKDWGYDELYVAVNISVIQLAQDDFVQMVKQIIEETGIDASKLHIEITETMLMESIEASIEKILKIKECGVKISLDDFGKGYSSLTYLKQLPIDILKIEKAFVDDILLDGTKNITGAIVNLGHELNLEVVAEGVEELEQLNYLKKYGCDLIQGYWFSRPIPKEDTKKFIEKNVESE